MGFATLEDESGSAELIIFPAAFNRADAVLRNGQIVFVEGKLSNEEDDGVKIICDKIIGADVKRIADANKKLYLKIPSKESECWDQVSRLINLHRGDISCVLYFADSQKTVVTKKDFGIDGSAELLAALRKILGSDQVIMK